MIRRMRWVLLIGLAGIIVCGAAVFYTHHKAHGTTAEERSAYESGEKAGREAPPGAISPTESELKGTAQKYFEQQGSAEQFQIQQELKRSRLVNGLLKRATPPDSRKRIHANLCSGGCACHAGVSTKASQPPAGLAAISCTRHACLYN